MRKYSTCKYPMQHTPFRLKAMQDVKYTLNGRPVDMKDWVKDNIDYIDEEELQRVVFLLVGITSTVEFGGGAVAVSILRRHTPKQTNS